MATIIDIANAVTADINRGSFDIEFTAAMLLLPEFELKDMKTLKVTVVPKAVKSENLTRDTSSREVQVDIGVQQKTADSERIAALLKLVEDIIAVFERKRLTDYARAVCVKGENDPVYDLEHMRQMRQFTSVITLTFKVI